MIPACFGIAGLAIVVAGTAIVVYQSARARYRARLPAALLDELVHHKIGCRHEPPARVALELRTLLGCAPPVFHDPLISRRM